LHVPAIHAGQKSFQLKRACYVSFNGWRFSVERFEVIDRIVFFVNKKKLEKNPCRNAKRNGKLQVISQGSHQATLNRLRTHYQADKMRGSFHEDITLQERANHFTGIP
jgi:hypothetical protein